jgi:lipid II:glycine glycyltransferase (peptidoglycan interpeptide bridge formation enzyme)
MIEVITEKADWKRELLNFNNFDFYHTYDYHHLSKKEDEAPILLVYKRNNSSIAIPFLKRKINGTSFSDLTSVYGYAGPIYNNVPLEFNNSFFANAFNEYLHENHVVSVFSRLHPYLKNQFSILNGIGETPVVGKVVNIDLTKSIAEQRTQYGKSTKNRVNKCRRIATVKEVSSPEDIEIYIGIYYENMDRLGAQDSYYFTREYFFDLLACEDFNTRIFLVLENETGKAMAGSMFIETNSTVQFHLSGTRTEFLKWAPANLFLDEMRLLATEEEHKVFNLGGGLGGQEDSLFKFKASFSKDYRDFRVWRYVNKPDIYKDLAKGRIGDFFPLYRQA